MSKFNSPIEAADHCGPSIPDMDMLKQYAPESAWKAAFKRAANAPMQRFRMGSALVSKKGELLASGCAHRSDFRMADASSTHAERHALMGAAHLDLEGSTMVVASLNKNGDGCPWSCCPCASCARALVNRHVQWVVYPQRDTSGKWTVKMERPIDILERVESIEGDFARHQRACQIA